MSSPLSLFMQVKTLDFWKKRIHASSRSLRDRVSLLVLSALTHEGGGQTSQNELRLGCLLCFGCQPDGR